MTRTARSTLFICLAAAGATAQAASDDADVIALRAEARQLEEKMYTLYNGLNSDDEFDVTCDEYKVTGSTIPEWQCNAAFMRNAGTRASSNRFDNPGSGAANTQGGFIPQSREQVAFGSRKKTQQLNEEMLALARKNPELAAAMIAYNDKRQQLEKLEK